MDKCILTLTLDELHSLELAVIDDIVSLSRIIDESDHFRPTYFEGELKLLKEILSKIKEAKNQ